MNMFENYPKKIFLALCLMGGILVTQAQTARVQVIHNCADDIADSVDVYLNGNLLLDNFAFRTATSFIDAPAGVPIDIDVAPKTSTSVANSIYNLNTTLVSGETYVIVAAGITGLSSTTYSNTPAFELDVFPMAREQAATAGNTDVLVYHGATDAPTVDVYESRVLNATASDDLMYSDFDGYLELPANDYTVEVRDASGTTVVASYEAPLQALGLQDSALTVLASGFLDPSANGNGPAFGLYAALPAGGNLIALPNSTARLQVIHNCADDIADSVDVYLNGNLLLDNFAFRTATPFIDAPAGVTIDIDVAPKTSTSVANSIYNLSTALTSGETYVVVAAGITGLSSTTYSVNPPFELDVFPMAREQAATAGNTDVLVYHGATDAPTVDIYESSVLMATASDDLMYSDFDGYLELPNNDYIVEVRDASGTSVVASYLAPLQTLALEDSAITVLASGFLDPSVNGNGPAFGLFAALATGGNLIALPEGFVGLNETAGMDLSIYPNPSKGTLFINGLHNGRVIITNLSGKVVKEVNNTGDRIDIRDLSKGFYQVSIEQEGQVFNVKLIKE
ncbi:MAG: hypothetical protein CMI36_07605 [Owenweeksia sp.]|nr:hypothetical protein [Owenweeksia sp.]MBF98840.1 hypothetical protein [Owenweeksia sp.]|tara:strand:+ start:1745 stop:3445 length:1701 start_codon:yes stop_codon:yes gene_type:complete